MDRQSPIATPDTPPQVKTKNQSPASLGTHTPLLTAVSSLSLLLASCGSSADVSAPDLDQAQQSPAGAVNAIDSAPTTPAPAVLERVMDERAPVMAATPPPPITGGSLRVLENGTTAVAADPARDVIHFVDLESAAVISSVQLSAGARPGRITESPGQVHVVLSGAGQVLSLDQQGNTVWQVNVCPEPQGLDYLSSADRVLLSCRDGRVMSIAPADGQTTLFTSLATDLRDVLVVPPAADSGTTEPSIYVSRFRSAELIRVNTDGTVAPALTLPDITLMRTEPLEEAVDVSSNAPPSLGGIVEAEFAPNVAWRARAVDGEVAVLHQRAQRGEVPVAKDGGYGTGGCERVVQPGVSKLGQEAAVLTSLGMSMVHVGVDFAVSPDGKWWAVADAGVTDPEVPREFIFTSNEPTPGPVTAGGTAAGPALADDANSDLPWPQGNAPVQIFSAAGLNLTEPQQSSDEFCGPSPTTSLVGKQGVQATAVEFNPTRPAQLVALLRQPSELWIQDDVGAGTAVRSVALGGADITDTGHDLFHRVDTSVACVHCHPGGAEDGHVWNFEGFGDRRTQSLETGLRAPFHWDGEFADLSHLMTEVFQGRMSAAPQAAPRVAALSDWLASLTPPAPAVVADTALVEQGRQLFVSAEVGCAACHSGAALTDGALHDVGTTAGVPFKTPSLLGVAQRLPAMHDGCAKTLRDRFGGSCGGGDQHGVTSHLTEAQLDALAAYLESL